jgi:hypothetical protein
MAWATALIVVIVGVAMTFYQGKEKGRYTWQYLFFLRVPLLVGLFLAGFPIIVCVNGSTVFENWFELDFAGLVITTFLSLLLAWIVMHMGFLLYEYVPGRTCLPWRRKDKPTLESDRCKDKKDINKYWGWAKKKSYRLFVFGFMAFPLAAVNLIKTELSFFAGLGAVAVGLLVALLVPGLARFIHISEYLRTSKRWKSFIDMGDRFFRRQRLEVEGVGYTWEKGLAFLLAVIVLYIVGFFFLDPGSWGQEYVPAIAYVLVLMMLMVALLSVLTLVLDRFRIPLLTALLVLGIFGHSSSGKDHFYPVQPAGDARAVLEESMQKDPADSEWLLAFERRNKSNNGEPLPYVVIVAASGGGITAARWSTEVLANITKELEPAKDAHFLQSIVAVSGVSGGSVGMVNFAKAFEQKGMPGEADLRAVVDESGRSSLGAVGWGLVYYDLWRTFLPQAVLGGRDRGWALETRWSAISEVGDDTLDSWRTPTLNGRMPVVFLGATVVESGTRIIASPLNSPDRAKFAESCREAKSFSELHPDYTLRAVTAARLSATFPYVTPIARADIDNADLPCHLADGGYYDNYGVLAALDYLKAIRPVLDEKRQKVAFIQIRASNPDEEAKPDAVPGFFSIFTGPIQTLLHVRAPSQVERNDRFVSYERKESEVTVETFTFTLDESSPLSWHLSDSDRAIISNGWSSKENMKELNRLRVFYGLPEKPLAAEQQAGDQD